MKKFLIVLFCFVQIIQIVLLGIVLSRYSFVDRDLYDVVAAQASHDVLHIASQIGRFDMISMMLSCWGLFIGVAALGGFWTIRGAAVAASEGVAKIEATRVAVTSAETAARVYMEQNAARLFGEVLKARDGPTVDEAAVSVSKADEESAIENAEEMRPGDV
ncbi:hypothetical protein LRX75_16180 [Rhizobium sp. DKSPLA3]|uniref:Uncharacterized protein n=1 Tax=Rhizobium quercicola TaxID=2901226 RepID=A0A9X1NUA0_9HYPH|nr:hypothetical protein [Rhizobium quercicola]MCD7110573.1 hypothetical protein [Rhizobium quercicola]